MLMMLNSYSADFYRLIFYRLLQISAVSIGNTQFNHKNEVKCWGKIVPGNYCLDLLAIFKRKHIVKMNSVQAVLAMVDGVVENH